MVCLRSRAGARSARQMSRPPDGHVDQMKANLVSSLKVARRNGRHSPRLAGQADFRNELCSKRVTEYTYSTKFRMVVRASYPHA